MNVILAPVIILKKKKIDMVANLKVPRSRSQGSESQSRFYHDLYHYLSVPLFPHHMKKQVGQDYF